MPITLLLAHQDLKTQRQLWYMLVFYVKNLKADEFGNSYDDAGSVLDSQHYIHPWTRPARKERNVPLHKQS